MKGMLFVVSLPRSGSTLLQRLLMQHAGISSVSEPWMLLPLAYMLPTEDEVLAPYDHSHAQIALEGVIEQMAGGRDEYYVAVADFVRKVYGSLCTEKTIYFLDKTPRYFLILPLLAKIFPDAKFIFLFRNPLAVISSIVAAFGEGRLGSLHHSYIDIDAGPKLLVEGYRQLESRSIKISYEQLVIKPDEVLKSIFGFLGLDVEGFHATLGNESRLSGVMGDKAKVSSKEISASSADKWRGLYNTRFRIWIAKKYIERQDCSVLSGMGYSKDGLLRELNSIVPVKGVGLQDVVDFSRSTVYRALTGATYRKIVRRLIEPKLKVWGGAGRSGL